MDEKCLKCGAERWSHNGLLSCLSDYDPDGGTFRQSLKCRVRQLEAEAEQLKAENKVRRYAMEVQATLIEAYAGILSSAYI